jgi:hypothetical protein
MGIFISCERRSIFYCHDWNPAIMIKKGALLRGSRGKKGELARVSSLK